MKEPDKDMDEVLEMLVASTRSPRGEYTATKSYPILKKRIFPGNKHRVLYRAVSSLAAIILFCALGWSLWQSQSGHMVTVSTSGKIQTITLPDGTAITLNHYTTLKYPEKFNGKKREVSLTGEAYFEVFKNNEMPFIVTTEHISVEVLGTHFNIEAYPKDTEIKTTLLEGAVAVSDNCNQHRMILKPSESAVYNKTNGALVSRIEKDAKNEILWKQGRFIFNNKPLGEIVRQLSNSYGIEISIESEKLREYKITARFTHEETIEEILTLLGEAASFDYTITDQHINLKTKN